MKKISVVVPVYNREKHLRQCLDSILAQTWQNTEVICVDDGSADASLSILEEYASRDNRVRVFRQKNGGAGAARNIGVAAATGEYLAFVDSDDFISPDYFSIAVAKMEKDGSDLVMFNPVIYDNATQKTHPYRSMVDFYRWSRCGGFPVENHPVLLSYQGCWDKFYRRSLLTENGITFAAPRIYEDANYGIYASVCAKKISVAKEGVYFYRKNVGSAITDKEINNASYRVDFMKNAYELREFLEKRNCGERIWSGVMLFYLRDGMFHLCNTFAPKDFKEFFGRLRSAFTKEQTDTARVWHSDKIDWFADVLQNGDVKACKREIVQRLNAPLEIDYE